MTPRASGLTRRGRILFILAVALALAAVLFGIQELYPLAAAAGILVLVCWAWVSIQAWDMRVSRHIHPARVAAGNDARVELTVFNHGARRSPPVSAADPFDGGRRWARFMIAPLAPGEPRTASYRLPTSKRGIFRLGPLELELTDPFGLARVLQRTSPEASLTVHPAVEHVSAHLMSANNDRDTRLPLPVIGLGGNEFYALREYVPGDDLRHVHWASTARVGDLVIRQPENLWRGRVTIALDLRSQVHDADTFEALLSAGASLALAALRSSLLVKLVSTSGIDTGPAGRTSQEAAILDSLAAASPDPTSSLADTFSRLILGDRAVVLTTDAATASDLAAAFGIGGLQGTTVVVFERRRGAGLGRSEGVPAPPRGRYVRVKPGGSFRAVWEVSSC